MLRHKPRRSTVLAVIVAGAMLGLAAQAGAASTYIVSGSQTVVDEAAGSFKMSGSLLGDWQFTSFTEIATSPLYRANGTELFTGCLDRARDGSCGAHDPSGTLSFSFRYWAQFTSGGQLVWGACTHPITGGTEAFAGAAGDLLMVDTPTPEGTKTRYVGRVTLGDPRAARAHTRLRAASATAHGCGM